MYYFKFSTKLTFVQNNIFSVLFYVVIQNYGNVSYNYPHILGVID